MPKKPCTFRISDEHLVGLQSLAKNGISLSHLIDTAIGEYLIRPHGAVAENQTQVGAQSNSQVFLSADDLTRVVPILAHFDKLPLDLILQLVRAKRSDPV